MKKDAFEKLSNEGLEKKITTGTSLLYVTLVLLLVYGVYMFYKMFEGTWDMGPQMAIPLFLFAAMLPNWVNIKNMKEELQKRKSKK
jgi:predicted tellurium resistance membrane protein TerC